MQSVGSRPESSLAKLHGADHRNSPVLYRVKPLEYEPAISCKCQTKAAQFVSWSDANLGRRFVMCKLAKGRCDFFSWIDAPPTHFSKELLVDLRDKVRELQQMNHVLYWQLFWGLADADNNMRMAACEHEKEISKIEDELVAQKAENFRLNEELWMQREENCRLNDRIWKERMCYGVFSVALFAIFAKMCCHVEN